MRGVRGGEWGGALGVAVCVGVGVVIVVVVVIVMLLLRDTAPGTLRMV